MNEPFCFKLLTRLPTDVTRVVREELLTLTPWVVHKASALKNPARRAISLRANKNYPPSGIAPLEMVDTCFDTASFAKVPETRRLIDQLCAEFHWTSLGMVSVSRMEPGGVIAPHVDGGPYFNLFHRIQVSLQASDDIEFICEDESIRMQEGEVWCFDNKRVHSVHNRGTVERLNLFFDAR